MEKKDERPSILNDEDWKHLTLPGRLLGPRWPLLIWAYQFGPHPERDRINLETAAVLQRNHGWE